MKHLSFAAAAASAFAAATLLTGCEKKPELHIYTWSDYIAPEVIAGFEAAHGCTVVVDTFDSNETMYAKLKAGGTGYDIIMPSSYLVATMAKEGLIQTLDHTRMPNVKANFDARFATQILDPSFTYNVPYAVTYTGFMYLKDKVPAGADVNSWTILANPAIKGKVTLLDDIREVIGAGLMANGYLLSSTDPAELDKAVETVLSWRPNIRKFDAESYKTEVASGATWIGHGYSTDTTQVIVGDEEEGLAPRSDIGFALPKEGFSIAFDEMVLAAEAPNPELAYAFMDYVYDGANAKVNMEYIMGPMPVKPGIDALDADYRRLIILDDDTIRRGQVIVPLDEAAMELYNKAWDKIKATEAR
ncbi:MAG: spermidine/putrescine ABC transporter substrate-binding protein [Kiritimatiellia bacterium]